MESALALLQQIIEKYPRMLADSPVVRDVSATEIRTQLQQYDFNKPVHLATLTKQVNTMFQDWSMHVPHPGYMGLYNPAVGEASIIADTLVALYNPQLAVWAHAPVANEIEKHVLNYLARKIGYEEDGFFANFTTGGSEANHTAVLAALAKHNPGYLTEGVFAFKKRPIVYLSEAAHHSFDKIIKNTGLGLHSLRTIATDSPLKLNISLLLQQLERDLDDGYEPVMIVGTAGTTANGIIDPLEELALVAKEYKLWFHVDAAWGEAAVLSLKLRRYLEGIELADSVSIDAHKWLSVSMGAGMFFTKHPTAVQAAFNVPAYYMPSHLQTEPYVTSLQWSRRCIGLKLFMTLVEKGEDGIASQIERQVALANQLRKLLESHGWLVINDSPVGVINFTHRLLSLSAMNADKIQKQLEREGQFWISTVQVKGHGKVLRACITSTHTKEKHVERLVARLNKFLSNISSGDKGRRKIFNFM